jgi:hypothetical protein
VFALLDTTNPVSRALALFSNHLIAMHNLCKFERLKVADPRLWIYDFEGPLLGILNLG